MMRKSLLIVLLMIFSATLYAQENYFGIRGGMNGGSIMIQPNIPKKMNWGTYEAGIVYRRIGEEKWVGGIQFEASYVETSFRLLETNKSDSSYVRSVKGIEIPFMWHPQYSFGKNGGFSLYLNAGPYFSYMMSSKYEYIDNLDSTTDYNHGGDYQFNRHLDVRIGYGLMGGVGMEVKLFPRVSLQGEFRYKLSFSDIWKYKAKVDPALSKPTDRELDQMFRQGDYSQSQITQMAVSVGLMYRFGKIKK